MDYSETMAMRSNAAQARAQSSTKFLFELKAIIHPKYWHIEFNIGPAMTSNRSAMRIIPTEMYVF